MNLVNWYQSRTEKDRRTLAFGGIAAAVLLLAGGLWTLEAATDSAEARVATKRADLAWMQAVAPRLRSMPAVNPDEPLPLLVDRTARDAGLSGAVKSTDPSDRGGLRVRLESASFDATVIWLSRLQQERGLVVEFATFEGAGAEGLVNVLLIFRGS